MKVFISWSKDRSKLVAELFSGWIKCVIQSVQPWISSQDIQDGELWFPGINKQLAQVSTGVIFITQENKNEPWILFEAGGLAKGLEKNRVVLFLVDLTPDDLLIGPLASFNQTRHDKEGVKRLVNNINQWVASPLDPKTLDSVFEKFWPDFEKQFHEIISASKSVPITVTTTSAPADDYSQNNDLLKEILKTVRSLSVNKQRPLGKNDSAVILDRISDSMLSEVLKYTVANQFLGEYKLLKSQTPEAILTILRSTFVKLFLNNGKTVPAELFTERINNLYHVINDNETLTEAEFTLL